MKNDPNKNGMTYASHTLPSLHLFTPHQLTDPPNTHCMPITHHHPRNPQNSISQYPCITQQLHHMHKYNNSKSLFSHSCNGSIITKQQSKITKTPKQCFSKQPTVTSEPDLSSFVVQWFEQVRAHTSRPPHATACSFHTYFHIITTCLICYMMH